MVKANWRILGKVGDCLVVESHRGLVGWESTLDLVALPGDRDYLLEGLDSFLREWAFFLVLLEELACPLEELTGLSHLERRLG